MIINKYREEPEACTIPSQLSNTLKLARGHPVKQQRAGCGPLQIICG